MSDFKDLYKEKLMKRQTENQTVRKIVFIILLLLTITVAAVITGGYFYIKNILEPVDSDSKEKAAVTIPIGSSTSSIGAKLEEEGIIKDGTAFRYYVKYKNESGFQAGDYELSPSMTMDEIIAIMKSGKVMKEAVATISVPEGIWLEDIAARIAKELDLKQEDVIKKLDDEKYMKALVNEYWFLTEDILNEDIRHPLEGYLFPATYDFEEEPSVEVVVKDMLDKTDSVLKKYRSEIEDRNYSIHEMMTLASIIEEEASAKADRTKISKVFYNRLDKNMILQTDPTVVYARGEQSGEITQDDLDAKSPYNTYKQKGLPIGPIANPGESSIIAAIEPADTEALYFYARPSGETLFSETNEEHNKKVAKYKEEWTEYYKKKEKEEKEKEE
ncbi:endolytic transglycosylase MltG [Guptibacillus hwajinpoensis]|uniref:endolytic transglycosylase MltG n=1 Tax=Guptibacillus hwajinpoensis TaxID=208199 RepID=UPI001CFDF3E4|nr:endolytic transglycosylase MltG [Pseudalkalibacillus hwajinpoensis]WLR60661.1 endolytic transglycosylase MltG [Pseudalkalibacillus hwajinpoensis]